MQSISWISAANLVRLLENMVPTSKNLLPTAQKQEEQEDI
jgi:hypothetical protein